MKKNHSLTAALAVTTIASGIIFSAFSNAVATEPCQFLKGNFPQAINNSSSPSASSGNFGNQNNLFNNNPWNMLGMGVAIAAGLFGTGLALKHRAKYSPASPDAETATLDHEFSEVSNFAIVVPPDALVKTQKADADLSSVG